LRGGFVHIPWSPAQAARHPGAPSLPTATVVEALRIIVRTALRHPDDLAIAVDATH
jgi:pyroglutamyl-peptidase